MTTGSAADPTPFLTVGELLERWISAHHDWRPATWIGVRSNVKALRADQRRVTTLTPEVIRAAMASWAAGGASVAVISGRFRILRSALGWAHLERIVDVNPLSGMRGPTRPGTRWHLTHDDVVRLLATSERLVVEAAAVADETPHGWRRLHKVEQVRLLVRLAAYSGARSPPRSGELRPVAHAGGLVASTGRDVHLGVEVPNRPRCDPG